MMKGQRSRRAALRTAPQGERRCLLLMRGVLTLIAAPIATAAASPAASVPRGSDPLALLAISGDTALVGVPNKTVSGQSQVGVTYVDVLPSPPSLSLKAKPATIEVGKRLTLSGTLKHFLTTDLTAQIERKVGSKLTVFKTLKLTKSGGVAYLSKPVTVKVRT